MAGPEDKAAGFPGLLGDPPPPGERLRFDASSLFSGLDADMTEEQVYGQLREWFPSTKPSSVFGQTQYRRTDVPPGMPPPHPGFDPLLVDQPGWRHREELVGLMKRRGPPPSTRKLPPWPKKGIVLLRDGEPVLDKNGNTVRIKPPKGVDTVLKSNVEQYALDADGMGGRPGSFVRWIAGKDASLFGLGDTPLDRIGSQQEYGDTVNILQLNLADISPDALEELREILPGVEVVHTGYEIYEPTKPVVSTSKSREWEGVQRKNVVLATDKKTLVPTGGVVKRMTDKIRNLYQLASKGNWDALDEARIQERYIKSLNNNPEYQGAFWTMAEEIYLDGVHKLEGEARDRFTVSFLRRYPGSLDRIYPTVTAPDGTKKRLDQPLNKNNRFAKWEWVTKSTIAIQHARRKRTSVSKKLVKGRDPVTGLKSVRKTIYRWEPITLPIHPHDAIMSDATGGKERLEPSAVLLGKTMGGYVPKLKLPFAEVDPSRGDAMRVTVSRGIELLDGWRRIEGSLLAKHGSRDKIPLREAWDKFAALHIQEEKEVRPVDYVEKMENFQQWLSSAPEFLANVSPDVTRAVVNEFIRRRLKEVVENKSIWDPVQGEYIDFSHLKDLSPEEQTEKINEYLEKHWKLPSGKGVEELLSDTDMFEREYGRGAFDKQELDNWSEQVRDIRRLVDTAPDPESGMAYMMGFLFGGWGKHVVPNSWGKMGAMWDPENDKWVDPRSMRAKSDRPFWKPDFDAISQGLDHLPDEMWHLMLAFPVIAESVYELAAEPFSGRTMEESARLFGPKIKQLSLLVVESGLTSLTNANKTLRDEGILSLTFWMSGWASLARGSVRALGKAKAMQWIKKKVVGGELRVTRAEAAPKHALRVESSVDDMTKKLGKTEQRIKRLEGERLLSLSEGQIAKLSPAEVTERATLLKRVERLKDNAAGYSMNLNFYKGRLRDFGDMVMNPQLAIHRRGLGVVLEATPSLAGFAMQEMHLLGSGIPTMLLAFDLPKVLLAGPFANFDRLRWYLQAPSERLPLIYMNKLHEMMWTLRVEETLFKSDLLLIAQDIQSTVRKVFQGQHDDIVIKIEHFQDEFRKILQRPDKHFELAAFPDYGYKNLMPVQRNALDALYARAQEIEKGLPPGKTYRGDLSVPGLVFDEGVVIIEAEAIRTIRRKTGSQGKTVREGDVLKKKIEPVYEGDDIKVKLDPEGQYRVLLADGSLGELIGENVKFVDLEADIVSRGAWVKNMDVFPLLKPEHQTRIDALLTHMNEKGVVSLSRRSVRVQRDLRSFEWTDLEGRSRVGLFEDADAVRKFYWPQIYRKEQTLSQMINDFFGLKSVKAKDKQVQNILEYMARPDTPTTGVQSTRWMNRRLDRIGVDMEIREKMLGLQDNLPLEVFGGMAEAKFVLETHKLYKRMAKDPRITWQGKGRPSGRIKKDGSVEGWMLLDDAAIKKFGGVLGQRGTGRGVPLYGMIQGKYVRSDIVTEMLYLQRIGQQLRGNLFAKFVTVHKGMVTFMNPATTFRNLYTNIFILGPMAGMNLINPANWRYAKQALEDMEVAHVRPSVEWNQAYADGAFSGNFVRLETIAPEGRKAVMMAMKGMFGTGRDQIMTPIRGLHNLIHNRNLKGFTAGMKKFIWENPGALYAAMDDYFRYATYLKYTKMGMSGKEAGIAVQKAYVNYGDVAGIVQYLRTPVAKGIGGKLAWSVAGVEFMQFVHGSLKALAGFTRRNPFKGQAILHYTDLISGGYLASAFGMDKEKAVATARFISRNMPYKGAQKYHPVDRSPVIARLARWITGDESVSFEKMTGDQLTVNSALVVKSAFYDLTSMLVTEDEAIGGNSRLADMLHRAARSQNPVRTVMQGLYSIFLTKDYEGRGRSPYTEREILQYRWDEWEHWVDNTKELLKFTYASSGWPLFPPGHHGSALLTAYTEQDRLQAQQDVNKLEEQRVQTLETYGVASIKDLEENIEASYAEARQMPGFTEQEADLSNKELLEKHRALGGLNSRLALARERLTQLGPLGGGPISNRIMTMRHAIAENIFGLKFRKVKVPALVQRQLSNYARLNMKSVKDIKKIMMIDPDIPKAQQFFKAFGKVNEKAWDSLYDLDKETFDKALKKYQLLMVKTGLENFGQFKKEFRSMPGLSRMFTQDDDLNIEWKQYPTDVSMKDTFTGTAKIDLQAWRDIMLSADMGPIAAKVSSGNITTDELEKMYTWMWGPRGAAYRAQQARKGQMGWIPSIIRMSDKWREFKATQREGRAMDPGQPGESPFR